MRIFHLPRVFIATFKASNPGLYEFLQGWAQKMINENRAFSAWRAHQSNGFTTNLWKIHGELATKIICELEFQRYPAKHIWSEKNLDCQNSVNKAKAPRQDNTPKLQVFFVHFFFFFFNMYRKKQHYDKATPLDWRTLKIQRVDWAQL